MAIILKQIFATPIENAIQFKVLKLDLRAPYGSIKELSGSGTHTSRRGAEGGVVHQKHYMEIFSFQKQRSE